MNTHGLDLNLNVGSFERAVEFIIEHRPGSTLKLFEVDRNWLRNLRAIATPEQAPPQPTGALKDVTGVARNVDTRTAADQLQLDGSLVGELGEFIVQGTGRELIFLPRTATGRPR